ncbi:MAG: choice-of-anchor B family protein [Armatimonadetes bacterium]|nr:choice-of-anchor B family protein [Armatimonadota bacterium]NOG93192.1 choice-of-anchor B family protein [Armatimonadota bacterium]
MNGISSRFAGVIALAAMVSAASAQFTSDKVALRAHINLTQLQAANGNSCWGYVSPSGREYALMGCSNKIAFVEITDPANPVYFASIPHTSSLWADVKVYGSYAYVVSEASGVGIQVIDLSDIDNHDVTLVRTITNPGRSHNVAVDTVSGYLYTCGSNEGSGTTMCFSLANPANPVRVGPNSMTPTYQHDIMPYTYTSGPYAGRQVLFGSSTSRGIEIYDVTNKNSPFLIKRVPYPNIGYCHQAWLSRDEKYLYVDDEFDEEELNVPTRTIVIDVSSLETAFFVRTFSSGMPSTDHNQYQIHGFLYQANYTSGLRIFDTNDNPTNPVQVGWFDTYPANNQVGYHGAWNTYPFFPSGIVIVSDIEGGLFILDPGEAVTRVVSPDVMNILRGALLSGGLNELKQSDNQYVKIRRGVGASPSDPPLQVLFESVAPSESPHMFTFALEASVNTPGLAQRIELFNFATNSWETLDSQTASTTDATRVVNIASNRSAYVEPGTRKVRAKVSYSAVGPTSGASWVAQIDRVTWTLRP